MNKFNVETPQDWKNKLYAKTSGKEERKEWRFKPVMAAVTVILIFALTTTAFAFTTMPDFFKSLFQGSDEYLDPLYMPKNAVLDSDTDELEVLCTGIMGDKNNLAISFAVKSKGDTAFDINNHYIFDTTTFRIESEEPSNNDGYSATFCLNYFDDKTLLGDLYISGNSGNGFTGKELKIALANLECLKSEGTEGFERILDCRFESEIAIDYADTSKELSALKSEITYENVVFSPVCSEISNISLNAEFKVIEGDTKELGEAYPFESVTVTFKDGTVSEFNFSEKTENQNIIYVNSVMQTEETYVISGIFGEAVDAKNVLSVEFSGVKSFVE